MTILTATELLLWARPAAIWYYLFGPVLFFLSVFLILLILVQRGRGGGLTGALGGMGGQSAFGSKAGDIFTTITVVTTAIWFAVSMLAIGCLQDRPKLELPDEPSLTGPAGTGGESTGSGAAPVGTGTSEGNEATPGSDGTGTEAPAKKTGNGSGTGAIENPGEGTAPKTDSGASAPPAKSGADGKSDTKGKENP